MRVAGGRHFCGSQHWGKKARFIFVNHIGRNVERLVRLTMPSETPMPGTSGRGTFLNAASSSVSRNPILFVVVRSLSMPEGNAKGNSIISVTSESELNLSRLSLLKVLSLLSPTLWKELWLALASALALV
jgi:hypothetical protein